MIVLDASVVIGYLFTQDAHHDAAKRLLQAATPQPLRVSQVTLAEVLVLPTRLGGMQAAIDAVTALGVREAALPTDAAARLAGLRVGTGLRLPDCCVLLAAQDAGAAVATFDRRLAAAAERLGLRTLGETGGG